jgi:hypothetical protein
MPGRLVVTQYISLDGVIQDPVGIEGSGLGNWTGHFARGLEGDRLLCASTGSSFRSAFDKVDRAATFAEVVDVALS